MKKIFITMSIVLLVIIATAMFFYVRYTNLDTYTWSTDGQILTLGKRQYKHDKHEPGVSSFDYSKLEEQIGKIEEGGNFKVWSIKGESIDERIAITGFMFPAETFSRIK